MVEPMGQHQILPEPVRAQAVPGGLVVAVPVPPHSQGAEDRIMLMPLALGPRHLQARLDDPAPLGRTQFVMP